MENATKSICRKLAGSMALLTAILIAITCATGYWIMAKVQLAERSNTLVQSVSAQARDLSDKLERQKLWLETLSDEIILLDTQNIPLQDFLLEKENTNGNLSGLRLVLDENLYSNGNKSDIQEDMIIKWYQDGMQGLTYLEPDFIDGKMAMTILIPIRREGIQVGVLAADFSMVDLLRNVSQIKMLDGGYPTLLSQSGAVLFHPTFTIGKDINTSDIILREGTATLARNYKDEQAYFAMATIKGPEWKFIYTIDRITLLQPLNPILWVLIVATLLGAGIAALLTIWRMEALADPLRELIQMASEMIKCHYKIKVHYDINDEFGSLCRELERGCYTTGQNIDELAHILHRMAQGDFTGKTNERFIGDFAPIGESIDKIADAMHNVFKQVNLTAKWALGGSHQVSGVLGRLSTGITSQTNSAEELNKAATLLRHESNQNALNANRAQEVALGMNADLRESARQTALLRDALQNVDDVVRELTGLLDILQTTTSQGRMLSISASAEAERAGIQAQAYALTVDELREQFVLAQDTARTAYDKLTLARETISQTQVHVKNTAVSIHDVTKKNGQTTEYIGRIASTAQLQAQAAAKMSKEVSVISVVIQGNTQLAEQFDLSFRSLADQAKLLSNMATVFYTKGQATEDEKSAPIIFDEDSGGFSVT